MSSGTFFLGDTHILPQPLSGSLDVPLPSAVLVKVPVAVTHCVHLVNILTQLLSNLRSSQALGNKPYLLFHPSTKTTIYVLVEYGCYFCW